MTSKKAGLETLKTGTRREGTRTRPAGISGAAASVGFSFKERSIRPRGVVGGGALAKVE
jgi:hypothetical protein